MIFSNRNEETVTEAQTVNPPAMSASASTDATCVGPKRRRAAQNKNQATMLAPA